MFKRWAYLLTAFGCGFVVGAMSMNGPPVRLIESPIPAWAVERTLFAAEMPAPPIVPVTPVNPQPNAAVPKAAICLGATPAGDRIAVQATKPLRLTAAGSQGVAREWRVWPKTAAANIMLDAFDRDGTPVLVLFPADSQAFTVQQISTGGAGQIADASVLVVIEGTPPNPLPPGPVDPPKPPQPAKTIEPGKLWLMCFVADLTQRTPTQASIESSVPLRKLLDAKGNHFRSLDPATTPEDFKPWLAKAQTEGLPRVLVVDAQPSPATVAESAGLVDEQSTIALVKKWGGQ